MKCGARAIVKSQTIVKLAAWLAVKVGDTAKWESMPFVMFSLLFVGHVLPLEPLNCC